MADYLFPDKKLLLQFIVDRQKEEKVLQCKQKFENSLNKFCYLITRMTKEELLVIKGMLVKKVESVVEMPDLWMYVLKRVNKRLDRLH